MKRYTDEEFMAAIRAEWLRAACSIALDNYVGGKVQINSRLAHYKYHENGFVVAYADRVSAIVGCSMSASRSRVRKLADKFGFKAHQPRDYGRVKAVAAPDEAKRLIEVGRRWWTHLGYCETELRPKVKGHRYPADESEVPS